MKYRFLMALLGLCLIASKGYSASPSFSTFDTSVFEVNEAGNTITTLGPSPLNNTLFVSKNGNDSTGNRQGKPFLTIGGAKSAAQAADCIVVYPGTYVENNYLKNGVNYYFMAGAIGWYIETNASGVAGSGFGIFDDRSSGATTNIIGGHGVFYYSCGTNQPIGGGSDSYIGNTNTLGLFVLTNAASHVNFEFDTLYFGDLSFDEGAAIQVINCTYCDYSGKEIFDAYPNGLTVQGSHQASTAIGVNWVYGELHGHVPHYGSFGQFTLWPNEQCCADITGGLFPAIAQNSIPNATNSMWTTADLVEGKTYCLEQSTNMRTWWNVKEFDSPGIGLELDGAGKHYFNVEKIVGSPAVQLGSASSSNPNDNQVWLNCQKLSSAGGFYNLSQGTLYANVMQYEDLGMTASIIGINDNSTSGIYHINGGIMTTVSNGLPVKVASAGSQLYLTDLNINNSKGTNFSVNVAASGLTLQNCTLTTSNTVPSIFSSSAQTVTNFGSLLYNVAPNANVTIVGPANSYGSIGSFSTSVNTPQVNANNLTITNGAQSNYVWASTGTNGVGAWTGNLGGVSSGTLNNIISLGGMFVGSSFGTITVTNNALLSGGFTVGALSNIVSFTLVNTNWISGQLYTNQTGRPIMVTGSVVLTTAGVAGFSQMALRYNNVVTNYATVLSAVAGLTGSMTNAMAATFIANGGVFTWTNTSSGAGDSSGTYGGQYMVY